MLLYVYLVSAEAVSAHIYISRFLGWHIGEEIRVAAEEIQSYIEDALISMIFSLEWIDWPTKQGLVQLINETNTLLGYPDWIKNVTTITDCVYNRVPNVNCKEEILYVHSYYDDSRDLLVIPLGMLVPPLFNPDYPATFKFGIFGQKLAEGYARVLLRSQSQKQTRNLWAKMPSVSKLYSLLFCKESGECLTNFYSKMERNYAAVLGLKVALLAYRRYAIEHGVESEMPEFPGITDEQLLFVAYGRTQCAYMTHEARRAYEDIGLLSAFYSDKTPPPLRLLGTSMATKEFGNSFGCENHNRMSSPMCNDV